MAMRTYFLVWKRIGSNFIMVNFLAKMAWKNGFTPEFQIKWHNMNQNTWIVLVTAFRSYCFPFHYSLCQILWKKKKTYIVCLVYFSYFFPRFRRYYKDNHLAWLKCRDHTREQQFLCSIDCIWRREKGQQTSLSRDITQTLLWRNDTFKEWTDKPTVTHLPDDGRRLTDGRRLMVERKGYGYL